MPSQATVTADTGPAVQSTAKVYTNVDSFYFDAARRTFSIVQGSKTTDFDMVGVTTITCTVTGANLAFTIS